MFSFIKSLFSKPQQEFAPRPSEEDIFNERLKSHQAKYPLLFDITKYTFGPHSATHESGDEFEFVQAPLMLDGWNINPPNYIMSTLTFNELWDLEKMLINTWKNIRHERQAEQRRRNKIKFIEKYGEPK